MFYEIVVLSMQQMRWGGGPKESDKYLQKICEITKEKWVKRKKSYKFDDI